MEFSPSHLGVIVCSHVLHSARPVLLVVHDSGGWNMACGGHDHGGAEDFHVVGVGHITEMDSTINECASLPSGFIAERDTRASPWQRHPLPSHEA